MCRNAPEMDSYYNAYTYLYLLRKYTFFFHFSAYHKPFLVAILPKTIEIKIAEPQATVQLLNLDKPRLIAVGASTE